MKSISIIFCVKNGMDFFSEALESILKDPLIINRCEIICIDDHSTDDLSEYIKKQNLTEDLKIRYILNSGEGLIAARNSGILAAKTKYIAFMDADDLSASGRFSMQFKILERKKDVDVVFGQVKNFKNKGESGRNASGSAAQNAQCPGAMMCRASVFKKTGLFAEQCGMGYFLKWLTDCKAVSIRIESPRVLVLWRRIHGKNISLIQQNLKAQSEIAILRSHLKQKRKSGEELSRD